MAGANVFGRPIQIATSTFKQDTTSERRARAEFSMGTRFADGKYETAREAVKKLKEAYGNGTCTLGLIYNATGSPITHVGDHDWEGNVYGGSSHPKMLENGQWGVFLHVHPSSSSNLGSVGAVVYRGKDKTGTDYDRMLAWYNNPFNQPNAVYTEIREPRHFEKNYWGYILGEMKDSFRTNSETGNGCRTYVKIDHEAEAANFEGIQTLDQWRFYICVGVKLHAVMCIKTAIATTTMQQMRDSASICTTLSCRCMATTLLNNICCYK